MKKIVEQSVDELALPTTSQLKVPRSLCHGLRSIKPVRRASLSPQIDETPKGLLETEHFNLTTYDPEATSQYLVQMFELHELLGRGSFGQVYAAKCKRTGFFYAIKKMLRQNRTHLVEYEILDQLKHSKIIRIFGAWQEAENLFMVLEMCCYPVTYIMKILDKTDMNIAAWSILADVSEALTHLHFNRVIHNDVKPDNILVTSQGIYKLSDFNVSIEWREYGKAEAESLPRGDDRYTAPECIVKHTYSDRTDVYAFGATIVHLLIGRHAEVHELEQNNLNDFLSRSVAWKLRRILRKMLDHEAGVRPSAVSLKLDNEVKNFRTVHGRGPILTEDQIVEYELKLMRKDGDSEGAEVFCEDVEYRRMVLEDEYRNKRNAFPKRVSLRSLCDLNSSAPLLSEAGSPIAKPRRLSLRERSESDSLSETSDGDVSSPISKRSRPSFSFRRRLPED